MKTQDLEKIPEYRKDTVFQAEFGINEKPGIITREEYSQAFKNKIPYYKDKPLSYWAMNQNRANVYHSAPVGINSFAKSSGFTQSIHNTRGTKGFHQNITKNKNAEEIFLDKKDDEFIKEYKDYISYDEPNNLFFTTTALRDYHYTKQKNNAYYHIQAINLPFQNIEFYYIDIKK